MIRSRHGRLDHGQPALPHGNTFGDPERLERYAGEGESPGVEHGGLDPSEKAAEMPAPPALETLCVLFGLSSFERNTLMLCAGVELDAAFRALCAAAQGNSGRPHATFGLALAVLPDAHWSALSPAAPLRHWRLIDVGGESLTRSPLRIDERVLHYLAGLDYLDERLEGFVEAVHTTDELLPSQRELAGRLAGTWSRSLGGTLPVARVSGGDREDRLAVAAAACGELGLALRMIPARNLPADPREMGALARLWEREAALSSSALLLELGDDGAGEEAHERAALRFAESVGGAVIVAGGGRLPATRRPFVTHEMPDPAPHERRALWLGALGESAASTNGYVDALVAQFDLDTGAIRRACAQALGRLDSTFRRSR